MNLEQFYQENYPIVYGYLYSLCGNRAVAEDLTSETFLKAIIRFSSYEGRGKPSSWLCAIGKNLYMNERKRHRREIPLDAVVIAEEGSMEEKYMEKDMARSIHRLTQELDETRQRLFVMRLNGMRFRDIADALGKSENWARVTFFRIRNEILDRLEGEV